jgi:hypothetical protein
LALESPDDTNFYTNDDDKKAVESDDHEAPEDGGNSKVTKPLRVLAPFLDAVCRLIEDESDISCTKKGMNMNCWKGKKNANRQWHNISCIISGDGQKKQRL